jgi:hypothetical protein
MYIVGAAAASGQGSLLVLFLLRLPAAPLSTLLSRTCGSSPPTLWYVGLLSDSGRDARLHHHRGTAVLARRCPQTMISALWRHSAVVRYVQRRLERAVVVSGMLLPGGGDAVRVLELLRTAHKPRDLLTAQL